MLFLKMYLYLYDLSDKVKNIISNVRINKFKAITLPLNVNIVLV